MAHHFHRTAGYPRRVRHRVPAKRYSLESWGSGWRSWDRTPKWRRDGWYETIRAAEQAVDSYRKNGRGGSYRLIDVGAGVVVRMFTEAAAA